jgi:hypothetical protein
MSKEMSKEISLHTAKIAFYTMVAFVYLAIVSFSSLHYLIKISALILLSIVYALTLIKADQKLDRLLQYITLNSRMHK